MVVGFNHNFRYKGVVYHVQTEDGGLKSPNIITLLYRGGNILASKKTSYADIATVDKLEQVVESLMKDQHREMLRRLKDGELDALLGLEETPADREGAAAGQASPVPAVEEPAGGTAPTSSPESPKPAAIRPTRKDRSSGGASLDEVILSYLAGEEDEAEDKKD